MIITEIKIRQIAPSEARRRILSDGSLQIINLDRYDGGTYVCTADNGLGPPVRAEYQLTVTGTYHTLNIIIKYCLVKYFVDLSCILNSSWSF